MRRITLVRHAHPDYPVGAHVCLGRTDLPLAPVGRMQGVLLEESLGDCHFTAVYSSPLMRCRETASHLCDSPVIEPSLSEQDMGPWDGLDFSVIQRDWPELYARRADEPLLVPPGAEPLAAVQARVMSALRNILSKSDGDIAVVAHASVIQGILASVLACPLEESRPLRLNCASYTVLNAEGGRLTVGQSAVSPAADLCPALAGRLLDAAAPGSKVEQHCRAVAAEALRLADALSGFVSIDRNLLVCSALLHDIARSEPDHAYTGAKWLRLLGFPDAAAVVEQHHDWSGSDPDEAALLFLADKCVQEDRRVSLDERFAASACRCRGEKAFAAHERRRQAAFRLRDLVNALCGYELIL